MTPQDIFAQRVVNRLDRSLDDLPQHIQARLNQARGLAVDKAHEARLTHVGGGLLGLSLGPARQKMMLAALAGLMAFTLLAAQYNRIQANADEAADIDEIILSDDSPVQSYTDPGFGAVFRSGLLNPANRP